MARFGYVHSRSGPAVRDDARGLLTFGLTMNGRKYNDPQAVLGGYHRLWERLDQLPGVAR
jgi:hypothetical protein